MLTKKQIEIIKEHTPKELKGTHPYIVEELGYYQKPTANWRYCVGYTKNNILVVTVFGRVE